MRFPTKLLLHPERQQSNPEHVNSKAKPFTAAKQLPRRLRDLTTWCMIRPHCTTAILKGSLCSLCSDSMPRRLAAVGIPGCNELEASCLRGPHIAVSDLCSMLCAVEYYHKGSS